MALTNTIDFLFKRIESSETMAEKERVLELFFDEVDDSRLKELEKLFTDSIKSATSVVRTPLPFTKLKKGLKARQELLTYFENKAESIDTNETTLFSELVKTNKHDAGLSNFEIAEHMIFLLLAAHDTTTSTLTSAIHHLSTNKIFYDELRKFILTNFILPLLSSRNCPTS